MSGGILHTNCLSVSPTSSILRFPVKCSHNSKTVSPSVAFCNPLSSRNFPLSSFFRCRNVNFKVIEAMDLSNSVQLAAEEDANLIVEVCTTRVLPPALTLEHGLVSMKEALEELKLNPPACCSGLIRFEVAVPPSAKALSWFCCQHQSLGIFPQLYISRELENGTRGAFGIGNAINFCTSSSNCGGMNSLKRYLLVDSFNMAAYGFIGINYDIKSSSLKHETGSSYLLIPQIELNESEGLSLLAGTLVWCDSYLFTFEEALHSYQTSLFQASHHLPSTLEAYHYSLIKSTLEKFSVVEYERMQVVTISAHSLGSRDSINAFVETVSPSS